MHDDRFLGRALTSPECFPDLLHGCELPFRIQMRELLQQLRVSALFDCAFDERVSISWEDRRAKMPGQLARLALILHAVAACAL